MNPPVVHALTMGKGTRPHVLIVTGRGTEAQAGAFAESVGRMLVQPELFPGGAMRDWYVSAMADQGTYVLIAGRQSRRPLTDGQASAAENAILLAWADTEAPGIAAETMERRSVDEVDVVDLAPPPKVLSELGMLVAVTYDGQLLGDEARYEHEFAEPARPRLCADPEGRLHVVGGHYTVTPRGITDGD